MNTINNFSFQRLVWLLRNDFLANRRLYSIELVSIFVAALLIFGVDYFRNFAQVKQSHIQFFPLFYIIGGLAFTASVFYQMNSANSRSQYLTLPASTLEKFTAKWLLSTVGWMLGFTILYHCFTTGVYIFANLFTSLPYKTLFDLDRGWLVFTIIYLAIQSVFLVGAVYFNKHHFFKTIAAIIPFIAIFLAFALPVVYLLFPFIFESTPDEMHRLDPTFRVWLEDFKDDVFVYGVGILFPFFMWVVAYFKLKEREV